LPGCPKSKGCEIIELPPKEEEKISKAIKEIGKKDAAALDAKGFRGTEFFELVSKIAEKYRKK